MAEKIAALTVLELNPVTLEVRDLEASVRFYGEVLGLPLLPRPDFGFAGAWFALGSQQIHLNVDTQNQDKERHSVHVAFLVQDAAAAALVLQERGVTLQHGPSLRPDGAVQVFFQDPDGYLLEMTSMLSSAKSTQQGEKR